MCGRTRARALSLSLSHTHTHTLSPTHPIIFPLRIVTSVGLFLVGSLLLVHATCPAWCCPPAPHPSCPSVELASGPTPPGSRIGAISGGGVLLAAAGGSDTADNPARSPATCVRAPSSLFWGSACFLLGSACFAVDSVWANPDYAQGTCPGPHVLLLLLANAAAAAAAAAAGAGGQGKCVRVGAVPVRGPLPLSPESLHCCRRHRSSWAGHLFNDQSRLAEPALLCPARVCCGWQRVVPRRPGLLPARVDNRRVRRVPARQAWHGERGRGCRRGSRGGSWGGCWRRPRTSGARAPGGRQHNTLDCLLVKTKRTAASSVWV